MRRLESRKPILKFLNLNQGSPGTVAFTHDNNPALNLYIQNKTPTNNPRWVFCIPRGGLKVAGAVMRSAIAYGAGVVAGFGFTKMAGFAGLTGFVGTVALAAALAASKAALAAAF